MEKQIDETAWRNNLKVGDTVVVSGSGMSRVTFSILKVQRLTPKQIIVQTGVTEEAFWKETGRSVGGGDWDRNYIAYPDPEWVQRIKDENTRLNIRTRLRGLLDDEDRFSKIDVSVLREVSDKLNLFPPKPPAPTPNG